MGLLTLEVGKLVDSSRAEVDLAYYGDQGSDLTRYVACRTGRVMADGCAGSWWTSWSAARSVVAVAWGWPVPGLRA